MEGFFRSFFFQAFKCAFGWRNTVTVPTYKANFKSRSLWHVSVDSFVSMQSPFEIGGIDFICRDLFVE